MFIDASVRNGFDTLKTSLKFFLFKIYTWVRRLSGAAGSAAEIQCGVNVTFWLFLQSLIGPTNQMWLDFPEQRGLSSPVSLSTCRRTTRTQVSGGFRCVQVQSGLWDQVVDNSFQSLSNVQQYCGPGSQSVSPELSIELSLILLCTIFNRNIFHGIYIFFTNLYKFILAWARTRNRTFGKKKNKLNTIKNKTNRKRTSQLKETQIKHLLPQVPRLPTTRHSFVLV